MSAKTTTETPVVNIVALEPLFAPREEPNKHRLRAQRGFPPEVKTYRRQSPIRLVNPLRAAIKEWRELNYYGASDTTRELLAHWFERPHRIHGLNGDETVFRYYFCQREAIETLIFLMEVPGLCSLSSLVFEYGGPSAETEALGIAPEEDEWARYAFKLATGAGKTKCMSVAIVWSYFHALRESESKMARYFLSIAPNLTVFERLKEDFRPEGGGPDIFMSDPLIPPEWRGDWNFSVVLQDEASGASTGGVPVASLILLAARPVGAHSRSTIPFADRTRRIALTIVVLPTPGPPVMTTALEVSASRTASAWPCASDRPVFRSTHGNAFSGSISGQGSFPVEMRSGLSAIARSARCRPPRNTTGVSATLSATPPSLRQAPGPGRCG